MLPIRVYFYCLLPQNFRPSSSSGTYFNDSFLFESINFKGSMHSISDSGIDPENYISLSIKYV